MGNHPLGLSGSGGLSHLLACHDHYEYDNADCLTSVMQGKWLGERGHEDHGFWTKPAFGKTTFDYDDADNLLSITKGRKQTTFTANDANQVVTENNQSYSYDANGNLLDDGRFTYTWDAENRLLSATNKTSGAVSSFTYDGLSRRISNTETVKDRAGNSQSTTTYYQWCGDKLCMALDSNGTVTERYYPQGEQINGKNRYYATDKLGSVMQVVNANGSLLGESRYDAYGKRELAVGIQPRFGYAGMFRHEPTGLNLTLYRAYNPQTGRWLSRDPIGENGGLNVYAYVGNDPLGYTDPYGLFGWADMPLPPQGAVDFIAGAGDTASFGLSKYIRDINDIGGVNYCSDNYSNGKMAGIPLSIGTVAAGGTAVNIGLRTMGGTSTLYHFTSTAASESILSDGVINTGGGFYGQGVYTTAVNSSLWARISGAASVENKLVIEGANAIATPFPGTFRILSNVPVK